MKGFGWLVIGFALGFPAQLHAQGRALADFFGAWERIPEAGTKGNDSNVVYYKLVFRPDSTALLSTVRVDRGDTLSYTYISKFDCRCPLKTGDEPVTEHTVRGDTLSWRTDGYEDRNQAVLQGQQLSLTSPGWNREGANGTYKRIASSKSPFDAVIANGFRPGRPVPAYAQTPTGTLADLVGAWENTSAYSASMYIRSIRIFRPDSTFLDISTYGKGVDTVTNAYEQGNWGRWERMPNDSIIWARWVQKEKKDSNIVAVLQKQQLTYYHGSFRVSDAGQQLRPTPNPSEVYKPIDWPKQP